MSAGDVQGVPVKQLEWWQAELPSRGGGKYTAEGYTIRRIEGLWLLDFAGEGRSTWRWVDLEAAKAAAQQDYEARIRSALDGDALAKLIAEAEARGMELAAATIKAQCEKCGGEGWLWGHELDDYEHPHPGHPDDTRYSCDGKQCAQATSLRAAAAATRKEGS